MHYIHVLCAVVVPVDYVVIATANWRLGVAFVTVLISVDVLLILYRTILYGYF